MKLKIVYLLLLTLSFADIEAPLQDTDGTWSLLGFNGYAGEIVINGLTGSSMFYGLFEAIKGNIFSDKLPIILGLQGGPGCSGETGMLNENVGPFKINSNAQPYLNPYTGISDFHVISVDYPLGAGFSFANSPNDMKNTTAQASIYLYNFLVKLSLKYPTWFNRDLYIFGDSYAGHGIPGISYTILMNNHSPNTQKVFNLKGVGMGDPWSDAMTQTQYYADYAYTTGVINDEEKEIIEALQEQLLNELNLGDYEDANNDMNSILGNIVNYAGNVDPLNIRDYQNQYNLGEIPVWLNLASTKNMLHAPLSIVWQDCNGALGDAGTEDLMSSVINYLPFMLENIKVMIWNGQDDMLVNSMGTQAFIEQINWPYIQNFLNVGRQIWKVDGQVAGYAKVYGNLSFVLVLKAGHLMSHDQPQNARDMVYRFINNEGWK